MNVRMRAQILGLASKSNNHRKRPRLATPYLKVIAGVANDTAIITTIFFVLPSYPNLFLAQAQESAVILYYGVGSRDGCLGQELLAGVPPVGVLCCKHSWSDEYSFMVHCPLPTSSQKLVS